MLGLCHRLPSAFLENDHVMNWLLEEDVMKGLTAEVVRQRGTPVQATFAYKADDSWCKRRDLVLIIPSQTVGHFALCYSYGPLDQLHAVKGGKLEVAWCRLVFDLRNFCLLQFIRSEGKIRSWLLLEHVSTTKTVQTTTNYFEAEQRRNRCIRTVTITVEHDCALCQLTSDKCRCNFKQSDQHHTMSPVQSSEVVEPLKSRVSKFDSVSFSVPSFSGSLIELLSTSPSRGHIEVAQYSVKKGNLLHYSKTDCFTNVLPMKQKLAESCYFQALESLVSKTRTYCRSIPSSCEEEEDGHELFLHKTMSALDNISEHPGFSSSIVTNELFQWYSNREESRTTELFEDDWFLSPDSTIYPLDTLESTEGVFSERWDL
ncbi:hypothetical protein GpartN1_g7510.t1 [Galdieria partita]|uniref:Uncharacterized protein n=1 Tax=Galdieria partita TaxID=83374 RepID=A0A9C7Q3N8_9RHOD|nr:hypothetical protein GpartN1_g7510.t1 [Galdieria partita]